MKRISWRILLIGGSSGTGKTTLARHLAAHYNLPILPLDDLRLAILETMSSVEAPAIHRFSQDPDIWQSSTTVYEGFVAVAREFEIPLSMIAAHLIGVLDMAPMILEGDFIRPRMMTLPYTSALARFPGFPLTGQVRGLLLHARAETDILRAMCERGRGLEVESEERLRKNAQASWHYGNWLRAEADLHRIPVIASRPYESQLARARAAIEAT